MLASATIRIARYLGRRMVGVRYQLGWRVPLIGKVTDPPIGFTRRVGGAGFGTKKPALRRVGGAGFGTKKPALRRVCVWGCFGVASIGESGQGY